MIDPKYTHTAEYIYKVLFIYEFNNLRKEGKSIDKSRRLANIRTVQWTTKAWKRQYTTMRNLFNPREWK